MFNIQKFRRVALLYNFAQRIHVTSISESINNPSDRWQVGTLELDKYSGFSTSDHLALIDRRIIALMADHFQRNDRRPPSIAHGPHPTPLIISGGSPSSSDEKTNHAPPDSPESPSKDINEKHDLLKLADHSSSLSRQDPIVPPVLPVQGCEADFDKPHSVEEKAGFEMIPLQDDSDCLIVTVRPVLIGLLLSALGASVTQLFHFKPVHMPIKLPFLQIATVIIGRSCALIPGPNWWNPGPFSLKETAFSALIAATGSLATLSSEIISAYELYFDRGMNFGVALGMLGGAQLLANGMAGLLQPILIYPSQAVYPENLPSVSLLNSLFKVGPESDDQVNFFKKVFLAIGIYELFPTYIAPALQAINVFCLTLPKDQLITNIFGGARPFEGMGLFTISLDWSMAGGRGPLFMPLSTQIHEVLALVISIFSFFLVYSKSWHGAGLNQNFPFLSASVFTAEGRPYPYRQAIKADGTANEEFIQRAGLPFFTATFYLIQILTSVYLTSSLSHAMLNNYHRIGRLLKKSQSPEDIDPHRVICQKGFAVMVVVSFALTFGMSAVGASGITVVSLLVAMIVSFLMTLAAGFISSVTGLQIRLTSGIQMLGGLMFPGNVFQNMWFTLYGAASAQMAMSILRDIKFGQYMHLPNYHIICSQLMGGGVGTLATVLVTKAILKNERDVLISAQGNGVFSGAETAAFQARAISWGIFSRRLFLFGQRYSAVSWGMVVGLFLPIPLFVAGKRWPRYKFNLFNVPLLLGIITGLYTLASAGEPMRIFIGLMSQFWARKYRTQWFRKYNYILSAALDGGTELMVFFLAIVFQGGDGHNINFPTYFLNPPSSTPRDYCYVAPQSRASDS
ncbi:hypothetical protein Pst134EA_032360 [Puccinia striiformis f. sp. tritici]|uniref:uncharacterized protein n=1 Tax=Puccinia striiformis f. sp. tritici TaxID=168172 RepID=UPI0020085C82|nr:uncharacterized protein Pst134EA_032360 [Puccinia striiformis f. sp. tritici]KAH9444306.1 hypothetical protein Pst134EA_032360 [Puccinia striiformis f. sp. tritici]